MRILAVLAGAAVVAAVIAHQWLMDHYTAPGPLEEETILIIEPGSSLRGIATRLESEGVIEDALWFRLAARLNERSRGLKAGEYAFAPEISPKEVLDLLESGKTVVYRLTVPEGLTVREVLLLLAEADPLTGEIEKTPLEGTLLPETYHFQRGDARATLLARMREAMSETLAELWPTRAEGLPLKSPEEAVVLASIVEKETAVDGERALVASVFYNRLARGMRLQSDPTVIYAITKGERELGRALTRQDWKVDDPYNTYQNPGLPPGPIANPGRAALEAVLQPAESEYLYFVADGNGGHTFAKTYAQHRRNIRRYKEKSQ